MKTSKERRQSIKMKQGFTLLELIIVIVVIGILAGIALPQFTKTKERALGKEAKASLKLIAAVEKIYRMDSADSAYFSCMCLGNGTGGNLCNNTTNGCNYYLKLNVTASNWGYWVEAAGSGPTATFTAYADRKGIGGYLNCRYRIKQNQEEPEVDTPPLDPACCP